MNPEARIQEPESKRLAPAKRFDQLIVWQKAHQFVLDIYQFNCNHNWKRSANYLRLTPQKFWLLTSDS
jgi:hypothetical protein